MAAITITLTDVGGNVKMDMDPKASELYQKTMQQGHEALSPAETYALSIVNHVRTQSKAAGKMVLNLPRVRR